MIDGILPAAGLATRMKGMPKFLLPIDEGYESLIERHVRLMSPLCETIRIPTRPELIPLLSTLGLPKEKVVITPVESNSMTETVIKTAAESAASKLLIVMPDTYFAGEQPYEFLCTSDEMLNLACWSIRDDQLGKLGQVKVDDLPEGFVSNAKDKDPTCEYPHAWGAMSLSKSILSYANVEMPHTGYLIPTLIESNISIYARAMSGRYYDCGTPGEYIRMLVSESGNSLTAPLSS